MTLAGKGDTSPYKHYVAQGKEAHFGVTAALTTNVAQKWWLGSVELLISFWPQDHGL
jgi:hypothetical protein